jgi:hypothetical protein
MDLSNLVRARLVLPCVGAALFLAACGGERTDVSQGVKNINDQVLSSQGASLDCPKEIDGGEGATFDCKLKGTETGKEASVKMKVTKQGKDLAVDIADQPAFQTALTQVTS